MHLARTLAFALLCLVILVVVFAGLPFPSYHASWLIAVVPLSISGVIGWVLTVRNPERIPQPALAAAVILVVAVAISAYASPRPVLAFPALWRIGTGVGTALLAWHAATMVRPRRDLQAIAAIFLVSMIVTYLGQVAVLWARWLDLGMRADQLPLRPAAAGGVAGLPTWLADQVLLLTPVVVATISWKQGAPRILASALVVLGVVTVLISGTRSLWLIAGGLTLLFAVVLLRKRRVNGRALAIGASGVLAAGAVLAWRLDLIARLGRDIDAGRSSAFASAMETGLSSPLLGTGPGTYAIERLETSVPVLGHYAFPNAHNLILNSFAELGVLGVVAVLLVAGLLAYQGLRTFREAGRDRPLVAAAWLGVLIVLGHAMVDVVIDVPGIFLMLAIASAFALVPRAPGPEIHRLSGPFAPTRLAAVAAAALVLTSLPGIVSMERAVRLVEQSTVALATDTGTALALAREAVTQAPEYVPALLAQMRAADRAADVDLALASSRAAVQRDHLAQHQIVLAVLLARSGQTAAATAEARAALAADQVDPFVLLNGAALLAVDAPAEAMRAAGLLLQRDPNLALVIDEAPLPLRRMLMESADVAVSALADGGGWDGALLVALATGRSFEQLPPSIESAPNPVRDRLGDISAAWHGDQAALSRFEGAVVARPETVGARWAWLLAAVRCDRGAADRWAEVLDILGTAPPTMPLRLGAAPGVLGAMLPRLYPEAVWGSGSPQAPYVTGTITVEHGTPECVR